MLRIGDRYRIPRNGVVLKVTCLYGERSMRCEVVDMGDCNHYWKVNTSYDLFTNWFSENKCERLPSKSENFNSLYDKLNADLL